ncbi:Sensory transduction histidine kinase [Janibacter sp. HTCC2649]|uniref:ATP-binding protein n=1 Tax=Janibacter sp. HTCC2649 TaxID=313589 RepID=UPI000066EC38|nr:ATP-binding protein [Janibacter sp. HTCC2649]EAP99023.1 Sensory transduction histidine kinase [Janibacter sp. HTCC2649]
MTLTRDLTVTESLRRLVFFLVGLMVVALLAGTVAVVGASQQVDRLVTLLGPANDANTSLLQTLTDAETGLRAYDATSNTTLLEPFNGAQKRAAAQQEALRTALGTDLPQWSGRLKAQDDAIAAWWAYANQARARLAVEGNLDLLTGKQLFDDVRRTNGQVGKDLQAQRVEARAASTDELRTALLLLVGGTLLASVLALWAGWRIARSLSASIEALRHVVHLQRLGDRDVRADEHEGPLDVRGLAADFNHLTETTRMLEEDQREALRMGEVTLGLATRLRGRVAAHEALALTASTLGEATGTTAAIFTTPISDHDGTTWRLAASWPEDALDESKVVLQPPVSRESIAKGLWLSGRLLESADVANDELRHQPLIRSLADQLPIGALLGTPFGVGDGVIGAMMLIAPEPRTWTTHERTALQQVTAHTARAFLAEERQAQQVEHVARLEALDRQKDEFVGTVSHELRTPLTSIAGYLEMLADGDLGELSPAQLKAMAVIERNTFRLRGLIEDVLVLNRIETRGLDPSFVPVDLAQLVRDVVQDLQPQARDNEVTLDVSDLPQTCVVEGDALQLGRALTNVVGNAVKFSKSGGLVVVSVVVELDAVRIRCRDSGIGIPAADMEQMFSRFFRASNATSGAIPGTGLGLAIVKAIIEAHHGELELHSVEGEGTTVSLTLPLSTRT